MANKLIVAAVGCDNMPLDEHGRPRLILPPASGEWCCEYTGAHDGVIFMGDSAADCTGTFRPGTGEDEGTGGYSGGGYVDDEYGPPECLHPSSLGVVVPDLGGWRKCGMWGVGRFNSPTVYASGCIDYYGNFFGRIRTGQILCGGGYGMTGATYGPCGNILSMSFGSGVCVGEYIYLRWWAIECPELP